MNTPNNRFRWGLVGYGDLAEKRVAAALQQSGELVAVWGRHIERTRDFAHRHNIAQICKSFPELATFDLDGVYVCTPPHSHAEYAIAAAEAGKHVLVEKPMASSVAESQRILQAANDHHVKLGVAYYRRAFPKMIRIRELIQEGILGEPVWVNIASHSWFAPATDDPKHWRVERAASGGAGALADIGVHRLDLLNYWLPGAVVQSAHFTNLIHHYEVEDSSSLILQLPNGAPVHAFFSWNSKTWIDRMEIVGSEGKIIVEPLDSPHLTVIRGREREDFSIPAPDNAHLPCIEDFVTACREGCTPLCDGADGLRTNQTLENAIRLAGR